MKRTKKNKGVVVGRRGGKKRARALSREKHNSFNWKKVVVVFLIFCFLLLSLWVFFFSGVLKVRVVKLDIPREKQVMVSGLIEKIKSKKILDRIDGNNLLLFSGKKLVQMIQESDVLLRDVRVKKIFPDTLLVTGEKRTNFFLWLTGNKCQLRDGHGELVKEEDCGDATVDLVKKCSDIYQKTGVSCLGIETVDVLGKEEDYAELAQKGLYLTEELNKLFDFNDGFYLKIPLLVADELIFVGKNQTVFMFNRSEDISNQLRLLRIFLGQELSVEEMNNLDYVDLRLSGKIIYKLKKGYEQSVVKSVEMEGGDSLNGDESLKQDKKKDKKKKKKRKKKD